MPLEGIVAWGDGEPALIGGRCAGCGTHAFPRPGTCPRCGLGQVQAVELPTLGEVWTWTVQHFPPKPPFRGPQPFEPFALAYVDLGPVRVESRLSGRHVDNWAIGDRVVLAVEPLPGEDPDAADARWAFVFRPESEAVA
jgi:uncharacterized OB-fold protein